MALYYSKGKIADISEVKSGTSQSGYTWRHIDVVLEINGFQGSVTKQVFRASGDRVDDVLKYKDGDTVQIGFALYAREWNGRLYNNVEIVTITDESGEVKAETTQTEKTDNPGAVYEKYCGGDEIKTSDTGPDLPF